MNASKTCRRCGTLSPLDSLVKNKRSTYGVEALCKSCDAIRRMEHEHKNPTKTQERKRIAARKWRAKYPDKNRAKVLKYIATKHQAEGSHSAKDVRVQYKLQQGLCYWCSTPVAKKYNVDHVVPLSRGGSNDVNNIAISCPTCNRKKGKKLAYIEWTPIKPLL